MSPLLAALVHSLWVGLAGWLILRCFEKVATSGGADTRHRIALIISFAVVFGWAITWAWLAAKSETGAPISSLTTTDTTRPLTDGTKSVFAAGNESERLFNASVSTESRSPDVRPAGVRLTDKDLRALVANVNRRATLQGILEFAWMFGVALGLARLSAGLLQTRRRLRSTTSHTVPSDWVDAWNQLQARCAPKMKVVLRAIEGGGSPFVAGIFEPAIILPLASCAGVSTEWIRVALAHELAHIIRKDWLVELWLRVTEALLFFNPFLRMINNRVRDEREACCDAWACTALGFEKTEFAGALTAWARHLFGAGLTTTPACSDQANAGRMALASTRSQLRLRVERLLGLKPFALRAASWRGWAGFIVLGVVTLGATGGILAFGTRALANRDRIELVDTTAAPYLGTKAWVTKPANSNEVSVQVNQQVTVLVKNAEGQPISHAKVSTSALSDGWRGTKSANAEGRVTFDLQSGALRLIVSAPDYAPKMAFIDAQMRGTETSVVLDEGRSVPVIVQDESGEPIRNARISKDAIYHSWRYDASAFTNETGATIVEGIPLTIETFLRVDADGYATQGRGPISKNELTAKKPLVVKMHPARLVFITVVDEETGKNVVSYSARISESRPRWVNGSNPYPGWSYAGAKSDSNGRLQLDGLNEDVAYTLQLTIPEKRILLLDIPIGKRGEFVAKITKKQTSGQTIVLELRNFPQPKGASSIRVDVSQVNEPGEMTPPPYVSIITISGRVWTASVPSVGKAPVTLRIQGIQQRLQFSPAIDAANGIYAIDYATLPKPVIRRVRVVFKDGNEMFFPSGQFELRRLDSDGSAGGGYWTGDSFDLKKDQSLDVEYPDGTRLKLPRSSSLLGARVNTKPEDENHEIVVTADLREIVVPVKPAGIIRVQVRDSAGAIVRDADVFRGDMNDKSTDDWVSFRRASSGTEWAISEPVGFSFFGTPVWVGKNLVFARGPSVSVSSRKPVTDVVVTLPNEKTFGIRILDTENAPVQNVTFRLIMKFGDHGHWISRSVVERTTEESGLLRFEAGEDLASWSDVKLNLEVQDSRFYPEPANLPVSKFGKNQTPVINVARGAHFRGRIVSKKTGQGVVGIGVDWWSQGAPARYQSVPVKTDGEGWFEFTDIHPTRPTQITAALPHGQFILRRSGRKEGVEFTAAETGTIFYAGDPREKIESETVR